MKTVMYIIKYDSVGSYMQGLLWKCMALKCALETAYST